MRLENAVDMSKLGEPDVRIAALSIWVHGRESPDATDYWDANWLRATAQCAEGGASVRVGGAILHLSELEGLREGCRRLHDTLEGRAELSCMEPYLAVTIAPEDSLGHLSVEVRITPDNLTQQHTFRVATDQSFLPEIVRSLEGLAERYPLRGGPG